MQEPAETASSAGGNSTSGSAAAPREGVLGFGLRGSRTPSDGGGSDSSFSIRNDKTGFRRPKWCLTHMWV
jgi:hypothetical protein